MLLIKWFLKIKKNIYDETRLCFYIVVPIKCFQYQKCVDILTMADLCLNVGH